MNKINYQKELETLIEKAVQSRRQGHVPTLLLHSCCAPCSSYVLEYLSQYYEITVLYYNPNIFPAEEYDYRTKEQSRLIDTMNQEHEARDDRTKEQNRYPIRMIAAAYTPEEFYEIARGYEQEPEGGLRCERCYELRLREAAKYAKEGGFDYFTTTLSISPLKNAEKLNEIGRRISEETGVAYLYSDFKKKNGYQRSTELSKKYELYRQDYCGCVYSVRETIQPPLE